MYRIRPEAADDAAAITNLIQTAFATAVHRSGTEGPIVSALRTAGELTVSLVAESDGQLVGHVAISPVRISDGSTGWYGLGPVAVLPAQQRLGIGAALIRQALDNLRDLGAAGCVVLGDPGYYARFGFAVVPTLVLPGVPAAYFQALVFGGCFAQGEVAYSPAFEVQAS